MSLFGQLYAFLTRQRGINRATHRRLVILERHMALTDQALADLDAATNEVADDLDRLRDQVANFDQALADQIGSRTARLRELAVDPENPVPPAQPMEPIPPAEPTP